MTVEKGDLVLISDGERVYTCIILSNVYCMAHGRDFFYSHCLETGHYGIVYTSEITTVVTKNFDPDFKYTSEIFVDDYDWYELMWDHYSYWPQVWPDDEDTEED